MLVTAVVGGAGIPAHAAEKIESNIVPAEMQPGTVITFSDDNHYVINQGGKIDKETEIQLPPEIEEKLAEAKADGTYYTAFHQEALKPVKGLKVTYADDGFILRTEYPDGVVDPMTQKVVSPNETLVRKDVKEGPGPNDTLLYTWGKHENQIWRIGNSKTERFGYGRATNFTDKIGERDNVLKKGDCATHMTYDNCAYGTELSVNAPKKGGGIGFATFYKRDKGSLPDAVLDIWKTGVEYFGYTWSSSLSINDVQYVH